MYYTVKYPPAEISQNNYLDSYRYSSKETSFFEKV